MITPYLKTIITGSEVKPGLQKIPGGCREHKGSFWVLGNLEEGGSGLNGEVGLKGSSGAEEGGRKTGEGAGRSGLAGGAALRAETHLVPRARPWRF